MGSLLTPNQNIEVRPSVESDVFALAAILRDDDAQEVRDVTGQTPVEALGEGFVESTKCFTILWKGMPAGMMGVVPSDKSADSHLGMVWMLGSDKLALFGFSLVKYARAWLRELLDGYDLVGNLVSARNPAHVRFLKHIGARIVTVHTHVGPGQIPAYEFVFGPEDLKETP